MDAVESIIKENPRNVLAIIVGLVLIIISNLFFEKPVGAKARQVNSTIKKSEPKVVDFVSCGEIEDLVKEGKDGKLVMCRCWKSAVSKYGFIFQRIFFLK